MSSLPLGFTKRKKTFIPRLAYGCFGLGLAVVPVLAGCGDSDSDASTKDASTDAVYPAIDDYTDASSDALSTTDAVEVNLNYFLDAGSDGGDASDPGDSGEESDAAG